MSENRAFFRSLPTPVTLFFVLLLALAPVGGLLVYSAMGEMDRNADTRRGEAAGRMLAGARAAEALIARNTLALRVAANGALLSPNDDPCARAREALDIAPALARDFSITDTQGVPICGNDRIATPGEDEVQPGGVQLWVAPDGDGILVRVGVADGTATSIIARDELASAVVDVSPDLRDFALEDGSRTLDLIARDDPGNGRAVERNTIDIAGGRLRAAAAMPVAGMDFSDRKMIALPILMWLRAAGIAWALVERMLTRPIRRLRRSVVDYEPAGEAFELPSMSGAASEVQDLGIAFSETFERIDESENQLVTALDGQRRLVREVHHRVKNNLQVVASLLNIHSRTAVGEEAQQAYAGIGRRVEALAVVHRNHFAEVEESRGIQLRPLITELASGLRASAPSGQATSIALDLDTAATTQDTAVAAAFLITEIVEYVMVHDAHAAIEIGLRRTSELTARLSIYSEALVDRGNLPDEERTQFDRVVDGLARQLRSALTKKIGSYSVELPIFPEK